MNASRTLKRRKARASRLWSRWWDCIIDADRRNDEEYPQRIDRLGRHLDYLADRGIGTDR